MAEVDEQERDYQELMAVLNDDDDAEVTAAEAAAEHEDNVAQRQQRATKTQHSEEGVVTRSEYLADKFLDSASEEEARLFAIYRRGDEDPRQLKALIELTKTKASEAAKALNSEVDEKAEEKATQIASEQYGIGPITPGTPSRKATPQEEFDAAFARAHETKDTHTHFALWNALPGSGEVSQPD